jgi:hypothetical protein
LKRNYEIYSYLQSGSNLTTGQSIVEELKRFGDEVRHWQDDLNIHRIFETELAGLKQSDAIILLEPAGHSSLLEAGIGYGLGKKVFVVGAIEKPEVFYLISEKLYPDIPSFIDDLSRIAPLPTEE